MRWVTKCFQMAGKRAVFHGFGLTGWKPMSSFPWYSVDSSSWGKGFRFGKVPLFDEHKGRFIEIQLGDAKQWAKQANLVKSHGFDWRDFADRSRNERAKICAISALAYLRAEKYLRSKFGPVYIPGTERTESLAGLRTHLVTGADSDTIDSMAKGGNMSIAALARAGLGTKPLTDTSGLHLHLADTGGISENYAKAEAGVNSYLVEIMNDLQDIRRAKSILEEQEE